MPTAMPRHACTGASSTASPHVFGELTNMLFMKTRSDPWGTIFVGLFPLMLCALLGCACESLVLYAGSADLCSAVSCS